MSSRRVFLSVSTIVFAASAAMTIVWCASMSAMGGMDMPGGWTMSMMWMRMPGQTWSGAAASFVAMWVVMMVAMMLPSLLPTLWRYHEAVGRTSARPGRLTALVGLGYFAVWGALGIIVFPLGVALGELAGRQPSVARVVPIAIGTAVLIAGVLQHSAWKARHLAFCREATESNAMLSANAGAAWRNGLCTGFHCIHSCAGLTAIVLALGVMDLRVMVAAAAAITAERLAPNGERVARVVGVVAVVVAVVLIARAVPAS